MASLVTPNALSTPSTALPPIGSPVGPGTGTAAPAGLWGAIRGIAVGGGNAGSQPSHQALTNTALDKFEREAMVGAQGSVIPLAYGRFQTGPLVAQTPYVKNGALHLILVWSLGEIDAVEQIKIDNKPASEYTGVYTEHFLGTASQTYPTPLHEVWPAYTDNLAGIAYTYLRLSAACEVGALPAITAVVRGRKIYDPRTALTAYSNNPALVLADYLASDAGEGRTSAGIDWASVTVCADICDELIGGKPRRTVGLVMQTARPANEWRETLRAYAGVMLYEDDGKVFFVPDRPRPTDHVFTDDHIKPDSLTIETKRRSLLPDVVEVAWTDPHNDWRDYPARAEAAPGARRLLRLHLPGITDFSEAKREAVRRLNASTHNNRLVRFDLAGQGGLKVTPGDLVALTFGDILSGDLFRVLSAQHPGHDIWSMEAESYHADAYSDVIEDSPDWTNPDLDDPRFPPVPTGLTAVEVVEQLNNGTYASRIEIAWDDMSVGWSFAAGYQVRAVAGGKVLLDYITVGTTVKTGTVTENVPVMVQVRTISSLAMSIRSTAAEASVTPDGAPDLPPNVVGFTSAQDIGGWVVLQWPKTPFAIGYHLRRGTASSTWATATTISERHDALSYLDRDVTPGTWRYFIKAVNSVFAESAEAAYADITVAATDGAQKLNQKIWTQANWSVTKCSVFASGGKSYGITNNGETWDYGYTGDNWDSDGLGDVPWLLPRNTYGGSTGTNDTIRMETSSWQPSTGVVTGQFSVTGFSLQKVEYGGQTANVKFEIGFSDDHVVWNWYEGLNVTGSGKYVRVRVTDLSSGPFAGWLLDITKIICTWSQAVKTDSGQVSVSANPTAVTFNKSFQAISSGYPQLTVLGATTAKFATASGVSAGGFNVYLFDANGNAVTGTVGWIVKGV